jgi:hypothetical protein
MSSVTRFIRQIPVSTTYYNADTIVTAPQTHAYEFWPSSSNYVGNYPNGFNDTTGGYVAPSTLVLQQAIKNAAAGKVPLLRDMGKTIFAPLGTVANNTPSAPATPATASWGYFRQVQLITPGPITQGPGFMGGVTGNTFGVNGDANLPDGATDYLTFYIAVSIGGVNVATANNAAYAIAGGQM